MMILLCMIADLADLGSVEGETMWGYLARHALPSDHSKMAHAARMFVFIADPVQPGLAIILTRRLCESCTLGNRTAELVNRNSE